MNITLGTGKKVHAAARNLGSPDCLNWGHKGSERYRTTTQEVTCARCIKKLAAQQPAPQDEVTTPDVPTSKELTYGTASAKCYRCGQAARYTIDGRGWCTHHRGEADSAAITKPPYVEGDPVPEQADDAPKVPVNVTKWTFSGTRKVHAPNGTGDSPRCQPFGGNGSSQWTTTDRAVDCRTCLADECKIHGHITRATPGNPIDTCDRCGSDLELTPTNDAPAIEDYATSLPAMKGETITQGHADYCAANGHADYTVNMTEQDDCARCGNVHNGDTATSRAWNGDQGTHAHQVGDTATIAGIPGTGTITDIRTMHTGVQYGQVTYPGDSSAFAPLDDITIIDPATTQATWTITRRTGDTITDSGTVAHEHPKNAAKWYLTGEGVYLDHERTDENGHLRWTIVDAWSSQHVGSVTAVKN